MVDGLTTGWHDAGASHLLLLEAVAGPDFVTTAHQEAVEPGMSSETARSYCRSSELISRVFMNHRIVRARTGFQRIRIAVRPTPATHCHALPAGGR